MKPIKSEVFCGSPVLFNFTSQKINFYQAVSPYILINRACT